MPELTKIQTGFLEPQGPFKLDPGTESAPGIYLEGDENTGLYRSAENEIAVTVDGTQKFKFTSEGLNFNGTSLDGTPYMGAIDKDITDTAVDVFVYDTSRDSDGGAWRKRTQHTSWYNEELNTATRGSRREFPAVAVIVAESSTVTIYDGDDSDLPMWMVFTKSSDSNVHWIAGDLVAPVSSSTITAINGTISSGISDSAYGRLTWCNFISDEGYNMVHVGKWKFNGGIGTRNDGLGWYQVSSTLALVNRSVNDVAMTVLPNAPIDDATGLPIPTIAVATNGGVSVIKDDGTVVDYTYQVTTNTNASNVYLSETGRLQYSSRSGNSGYIYYVEYDNLSSSDVTSAPNVVLCVSQTGGSGITQILPKGGISADVLTREYTATGYHPSSYTNYQGGLFFHKTTGDVKETDGVSLPNSNFMGVHIRPDYNTGWMHGDIKGAFLSDTDATNVTSNELVPNSEFLSNVGWEPFAQPGYSISGGLLVDGSSGNAGEIDSPAFYLSTGTHTLSYQITGSGGVPTLTVDSTDGVTRIATFQTPDDPSNGVYSTTFNVVTAGNYIVTVNGGGFVGSFDYISIIAGTGTRTYTSEADRSVNNKPLDVHGTITKSPVTTGAELIGYSGFSNLTNYLSQPLNSDLAIGNSDFSCVGWFKKSTSSNTGMIFYASDGNNQVFDVRVHTDMKMLAQITDDGFSTREIVSTQGPTVNDNIWHQFHAVRRSNTLYSYLDGNLLGSSAVVEANITNSMGIVIGAEGLTANQKAFEGSLALIRFSQSAPSAEQIKKMYEDEKVLFQENAACTLYGSSDAVTALAYDEVTERLHVGTSSGRSEFQGLRRINNTTTAVTTAISAYDSFVVEQ